MSDTNESGLIDTGVDISRMPSLAQLKRGALEKEIAQVIRQLKGSIDGTTELLYVDGTSGLKSGQQHRLDEVGGVDGMRVVFKGQVSHLLKLVPKASRLTLPDRLNCAMKLCEEHVARLDAFGDWLTEKTAPYCCQECVFFLEALHLVLQPYSPRVREDVMAAYWARRDPANVVPDVDVAVHG